jgi:hypothetical protein
MSGLPPLQEDLDALRRQQEALVAENQEALDAVQSDLMGLSKGGSQLSLYKDWHILHYLLTGKSWEPVDSPLGMAIMGGTEIPDVHPRMHGLEELDKDERESLIHCFHLLRDFYQDAAAKGHAMLLWVV